MRGYFPSYKIYVGCLYLSKYRIEATCYLTYYDFVRLTAYVLLMTRASIFLIPLATSS